MIAPEIERLANEMDAGQVVFAKMDCGEPGAEMSPARGGHANRGNAHADPMW